MTKHTVVITIETEDEVTHEIYVVNAARDKRDANATALDFFFLSRVRDAREIVTSKVYDTSPAESLLIDSNDPHYIELDFAKLFA